MHNFRELKIWKNSINVVKSTYNICGNLPVEENSGLINQMQRSSVSIASNIAEGSGRNSEKEFCRFIDIALSSSFELETQLIISRELYHIEINEQIDNIHTLHKMIRGFKKTLMSKNLMSHV